MTKLRFGAFLAPHHPIGENPTLQLQSNIELKLADRVYINFKSKPDLLLNLIYPFQLSSYRICLMYKDDN